jgi:spermidine synthase
VNNSRANPWEAWLYAATIFLSSFLLFQVQPIIAKMILPWFGGSSAVWSTCMVFFQIALLLGYLYAHWLHDMPNRRLQAIVHILLLGFAVLVLPIIPNPSWKPAGTDGSPSLRILGLLAVTIGLPYLALSSTSPLLQSWYSRRNKGIPYRLFALSNVASMLALLSYPVLVEPNLSTRFQAQAWSTGYVIFALACALTAWHASSAPAFALTEAAAPAETAGAAPDWTTRLLWLGLSACGSILLLGVTTFLTQDLASIPFLWIVPLSVYLLTFIICFDSPRWYRRGVFYPLLGVGLAMLGGFQRALNIPDRMTITISIAAVSLFVCCMVCHGEMVRLKPPPRYLTGFYLMVSAGGAGGGLFVGLLAPNLFNANYEFPVGLCVTAILATYVLLRNPESWLRRGVGEAAGIAIILAVVAYVSYVGTKTYDTVRGYRAVARNFYGLLRVIDVGRPPEDDAYRELLHGRIDHGIQMLSPKYHRSPVEYFCPASGIGQAMTHRPAGVPWRIGIVGLGTGTLAAYGRPDDTIRIYEINPLVLQLAHSQFSYLDDSPAKIDVALGDGRLSLESEPSQQFDMLVIDVFSGDSVPVHVLTVEAFRTYFRHLKPGGILSVNITNRYLNLEPVMETASRAYGKEAVVFDYEAKSSAEFLCTASSWVLIVDKNSPVLNGLEGQRLITERAGFRTWTDDYSTMFGILR